MPERLGIMMGQGVPGKERLKVCGAMCIRRTISSPLVLASLIGDDGKETDEN